MKRLLLIVICLFMTSCTYLGATEEILISSPHDIEIDTLETFDSLPETTVPDGVPITADSETTDGAQPIEPVTTTASTVPPITHIMISKTGDKIHYFEDCSYAQRIKEENRQILSIDEEAQLVSDGYTVCSWCAKKRGE